MYDLQIYDVRFKMQWMRTSTCRDARRASPRCRSRRAMCISGVYKGGDPCVPYILCISGVLFVSSDIDFRFLVGRISRRRTPCVSTGLLGLTPQLSDRACDKYSIRKTGLLDPDPHLSDCECGRYCIRRTTGL